MDSTEAVLAIDIGTTRTKAAWYDESLRRGPVISEPTPGILDDADEPGTINVAAVVSTVMDLAARATAALPADAEIVGVGVTSFLSHLLLDDSDQVMEPGFGWSYFPTADALEACRDACEEAGYEPERPIAAELLAPRLVHLARHRRGLAGGISRVISLKDLVCRILTGRTGDHIVDYSIRDYSLLRDSQDQPITPILKLLEKEGYENAETLLPPAQPAHHPVGRLCEEAATRLGLPPGIPVATGATDGSTAMYGAGILADDRVTAVFGTTDVAMRAVGDGARVRGSRGDGACSLSRNAAVIIDRTLIGGSTSASGSVLTWASDIFRRDERWNTIAPGAEGLYVAPGLAGERAPWNRAELRGAIEGLSLNHTGAHLARALREAQTYRVRLLVERILEWSEGSVGDSIDGPVAILAGGGNRTPELDALRAAILPWPVQWRRDPELSLCGTAIFALAAAKTEDDPHRRDTVLWTLCRRAARDIEPAPVAAPSPSIRATYDELYTNWLNWITHLYGGNT